MITLIRLSLRNLWRRRWRSLLTWLMILVGTTLTVFTVGLAEGTYGDMIELATRSYTGQFQVLADGYHDKPSLFRTLREPGAVEAEFAGCDGVLALTRRVECAGLLSAGTRSTGVFLVGVEPLHERNVSTLAGNLRDGVWLGETDLSGKLPILLGAGLARRLRVGLGDELSFVSQAADGSIAAELFTLTGILETGIDEVDAAMALVRLADAQEMLVLEGRVHRLVGLVKGLGGLDEFLASAAAGEGNQLLGWRELLPDLDQSIKSDRAGSWVFLVIILAVVLLGVSNTMMMAVFERTKEFGVLLALGTTPDRLLAMVLLESFWLSLSGVGGGIALGALINFYLELPYPGGPVEFGGVVISVMHGRNTLAGNVYFPAAILLSGLLAGLLPGLRAARLSPAAALRQN